MYTNVLVPFDGSQPACRALLAAINLCKGEKNADITVLQVTGMANIDYTSFEVAARMSGIDVTDEQTIQSLRENYGSASKEQVQEQVQKFFESLPENIDLKIIVKRGNPRDVICQYAEDNNIDCIVMGRRGGGSIRATLGSVSTGVLRTTDLPVLVVK